MNPKLGRYRGCVISAFRPLGLRPLVIMLCVALFLSHALAQQTTSPPFPTGTHRQLVRQFYSIAQGLPSDDVRTLAVTADGMVCVSAGNSLVCLQPGAGSDEHWVAVAGPSNVTALFAPPREVDALAGAADGVWALAQGQWRKEAGSPAGVIAFAAEPAGNLWALAASGVWRRSDGWKLVHVLDEDWTQPRSLLPIGSNDCFVATQSGLFGLMGKRKYWLDLEIRPGGLLSRDTRALARLDTNHFLVATDKGLNIGNGGSHWQTITGDDGLPILDLTKAVATSDGTVWLGSDQGLIRWSGGQWTYLASKRWLPDNRITAIAPAKDGAVWAGTPRGLAHIFHRALTLEKKAVLLQKTLESRTRRHGYVTEMHLPAPGVVEGATQEISDNDGMWTALYIASQSFRYAASKSPEAKAQAWRSMQALLRLESITGISGFPARAICNVGEPQFSRRSLRSDSEWHASPVEKDWFWKGETSSDELDGHYFAWYLFHELAANDDEKQKVRATCKRVTDHILDHGYYLIDKDGQPTTWGVWAPEKLNDDPKWWAERGLNSLEILSHLKVASHLTGDVRYERAARELIGKHHYALNTINAKLPDSVSHDNQLLFLSYYPLLQLERDPALRAIYLTSLRRTWNFERAAGNPLWNFIYGASTGEPCDVEEAVEALREIPLDFILWRMQNSQRADLKYDAAFEREGIKRLIKPLSFTERVIHKWDKNPFLLDGGSDQSEGDPTVWLLPYWMGRHHRLIE